jgi:hypothetical protein
MTHRAVLSEPTVVLPQIPGSSETGVVSTGTSGPSDAAKNLQGELNDGPPAKRPHQPDNFRSDAVADFGTGSKKKKRKRNKVEADSS